MTQSHLSSETHEPYEEAPKSTTTIGLIVVAAIVIGLLVGFLKRRR